MESRKITIISESSNGHKVIESSAETLGALKTDLVRAGVSYEDKTFRECLTRTELVDNASVLPKDVQYKGTTTNELVFTLTTANKKIRSGAMTRPEVQAAIKSAGLQDSVKSAFGRNFTQVSTSDLEAFLAKNSRKVATKVAAPKSDKLKKTVVTSVPATPNPVEEKFNRLVDILECNGTIEDYEAEELRGEAVVSAPKSEKAQSPYSEAELKALTGR